MMGMSCYEQTLHSQNSGTPLVWPGQLALEGAALNCYIQRWHGRHSVETFREREVSCHLGRV